MLPFDFGLESMSTALCTSHQTKSGGSPVSIYFSQVNSGLLVQKLGLKMYTPLGLWCRPNKWGDWSQFMSICWPNLICGLRICPLKHANMRCVQEIDLLIRCHEIPSISQVNINSIITPHQFPLHYFVCLLTTVLLSSN